MNILLLGGTADARKVVKGLFEAKALESNRVIYSVAGLVRIPELPCEVISGGFTQFGGLSHYCKAEAIDLILDITHPFAAQMSATAVAVAKALKIQCWRFHREAWQAQTGDAWHYFDNWDSLLPACKNYTSVILTAGQVSQNVIDQFAAFTAQNGQQQIVRTAAPMQAQLAESMSWLKAIGPFNHQTEKALLAEHGIDLLISKNSGGKATEAKLSAARELGIDVFMLQRPELPAPARLFRDIQSCVKAVTEHASTLLIQETHRGF